MKTERDPQSLVGEKIYSNFPVMFFSKKASILFRSFFVMLTGSGPDSVEHSGRMFNARRQSKGEWK